MHFTYAVIDAASIAVPLVASFHPRLRFDKQWFAFWPACILTAIVFIIWDQLFTQMGVWGFNSRYVFGPSLGLLPIEEIAFFICIPYASLFTYHCLNVLLPTDSFNKLTARLPHIMLLIMAVLLIVFRTHWYTAVTCALGIVLLGTLVLLKVDWLTRFFRAFVVILLPFFIVNGLLTGSMLDQPVVWYNDAENIGVRMLTIPVDDVFYGMDMLLLTTAIYEFIRSRALLQTKA